MRDIQCSICSRNFSERGPGFLSNAPEVMEGVTAPRRTCEEARENGGTRNVQNWKIFSKREDMTKYTKKCNGYPGNQRKEEE